MNTQNTDRNNLIISNISKVIGRNMTMREFINFTNDFGVDMDTLTDVLSSSEFTSQYGSEVTTKFISDLINYDYNSVETDEQFTRFKGLPWFNVLQDSLIIGGAGGIGSYLCLFLARAGFDTVIYDFDMVEKENLAGQFYKISDIGRYKVDAVYNNVKEFSPGSSIYTKSRKITEDNSVYGRFFFSAFDNMEARKVFFNHWKKNLHLHKNALFVDGRLEAEMFQIFCVTQDKVEEYERHLFDDSEIEDAPCTMKQTSHIAAMIASYMTSIFTNHVTNIFFEEKVRDVPFKYEVFTPLNVISRYE